MSAIINMLSIWRGGDTELKRKLFQTFFNKNKIPSKFWINSLNLDCISKYSI